MCQPYSDERRCGSLMRGRAHRVNVYSQIPKQLVQHVGHFEPYAHIAEGRLWYMSSGACVEEFQFRPI
jgi:hypothetical protein